MEDLQQKEELASPGQVVDPAVHHSGRQRSDPQALSLQMMKTDLFKMAGLPSAYLSPDLIDRVPTRRLYKPAYLAVTIRTHHLGSAGCMIRRHRHRLPAIAVLLFQINA